jgi:hypothetical protein
MKMVDPRGLTAHPLGGDWWQNAAMGLGFEVSEEYHLADTHCLDCRHGTLFLL